MASELTGRVLYGKPLVKPSTIETELEKIRTAAEVQDAAREAERGTTPAARVRATLKNVILLNTRRPDATVGTEIDRLIDKLCVAHPSRIFVVDGNLEPPPAGAAKDAQTLATAVSSRCFLADSGAHICSEEIYISSSQQTAGFVPNLLVSLLVPDVDSVLVLLGDPSEVTPQTSQLLSGIAGLSDLVVYDSSQFSDYKAGLKAMVTALSTRMDDVPTALRTKEVRKIFDINWPRLRRWRSLLAEGFDAERFVDATTSIRRVALTTASQQHSANDGSESHRVVPSDSILGSRGIVGSEGLLIAGWFLASLELTPETHQASSGSVLSCVGKAGQRVTLEFTSTHLTDAESAALSQSSSAAPAEVNVLSGVEIEVHGPSCHGQMRVDRRFEKGTAEIAMTLTESKEGGERASEFTGRSLPFPTPGFAEKILIALVARAAEPVFYRVVELSYQLNSLLEKETGLDSKGKAAAKADTKV